MCADKETSIPGSVLGSEFQGYLCCWWTGCLLLYCAFGMLSPFLVFLFLLPIVLCSFLCTRVGSSANVCVMYRPVTPLLAKLFRSGDRG